MTFALRDLARVAVRYPGRAALILLWYATRRRVRARGQLADAIRRLPFHYARWLADTGAEDRAILQGTERPEKPAIAIHLHLTAENAASAQSAIESVRAQTWPHWQMFVTGSADQVRAMPMDPRITVLSGLDRSRAQGLAAAMAATTSAYLVPLGADSIMPRDALAAYAAHCVKAEGAGMPLLYGDQDEIVTHKPSKAPWFKPDWDADMILAQDYVSAACALPVDAARAVRVDDSVPDSCAVYALLLDLAIGGGHPVHHLHRVTMSVPRLQWQAEAEARLGVLQQRIAPALGCELAPGEFGTIDVRWPLPDTPPMVSIIIPTRDRLDILEPCVRGVLDDTRYPNFEIVIADNGSVEARTLAFFDRVGHDPRVRVVAWPHPYNYSAINNFAVAESRGEFVCLLNNDTEVVDGDWLDELMRQACRPGIGAVGARLFYPDGSIQHAGVAVGMGNAAGHAHRGLVAGEPGYFAHALIAREATAVTAACLVVSRAHFNAVGGLDEDDLRIAYNDVDFCLKLRAAGLRNIYTPHARLIHHESKSRGQDMAPEHLARYLQELATLQQRWDTTRFQDPTHHPVLDRSSERYCASR